MESITKQISKFQLYLGNGETKPRFSGLKRIHVLGLGYLAIQDIPVIHKYLDAFKEWAQEKAGIRYSDLSDNVALEPVPRKGFVFGSQHSRLTFTNNWLDLDEKPLPNRSVYQILFGDLDLGMTDEEKATNPPLLIQLWAVTAGELGFWRNEQIINELDNANSWLSDVGDSDYETWLLDHNRNALADNHRKVTKLLAKFPEIRYDRPAPQDCRLLVWTLALDYAKRQNDLMKVIAEKTRVRWLSALGVMEDEI